MKRNIALKRRYPAFYRQDILNWRRKQLRLSMAEVARMARLPARNVQTAFLGKTKNDTVFPVCQILGIDWTQVHNFNLKPNEFHLAVLNGNGSEAGPAR